MTHCMRISLYKGSNRLCAFLYLKTEAQPASETRYSLLKQRRLTKSKKMEIISLDHSHRPTEVNQRWLYKSRNNHIRRFLIYAPRNAVKNRWVTMRRSERPTRCELRFVIVHHNGIPVQRTATATKLYGVRSAHGNERTGSKRSVMSDTELFSLAARLHHRSFLCLKFY